MPVLSICNLTPYSFCPPVPVHLLCSICLSLFLPWFVSHFGFISLSTSLLSFSCLSVYPRPVFCLSLHFWSSLSIQCQLTEDQMTRWPDDGHSLLPQ